ncbi:MAG TPA: FHA domain-containing serine/threonine-protein kinase [Gemmataceae bacterium]|nr:FHA domain-containing serine/threonine-protein kinase [Gemmataceae bacterium]
MNLHLLVIAGPDKGRSFPLRPADPLIIGRSKDTETRLNDPHVSRVHCQLQMDGDDVVVVDRGSASGTLVNGKRVTQQVLRPGDVIRVGETQLRLESPDLAGQSTLNQPAPAAVSPPGGERLTELVGKTLSHYEVGQVLAKGQSGVVFGARDTKEDRVVALKVLWPEFSKNDAEMQRFVRGMKTTLPLRHPNLVTLYAAGKTAGYCWMAMEFVQGESLTQVIQRIGTANMLDWRHALRVAVHISRALDYAHGHSIIHRNVTPQNILIQDVDKLAKLGDLMLAKALEGTLAEQITRPGEMLGDLRYMSPERTRGNADEIDGRSDIYSLGATVYHLLTGRPPCEGTTLVETVTKIRQEEPAKPTRYQLSIPGLFEGTVMKMLAKRPDDRFQTAAELHKDLERVAKFQGVAV